MMRSGRLTSNLNALLWLLVIAGSINAFYDIARLPPIAVRSQVPSVASHAGCLSSGDGYLRMRLRDAQEPDQDIDWSDGDMQCEGGLRPNGHGMRMMFAGAFAGGSRLRVVFGIAAGADTPTAHNVPTNVTVIEEDAQKLFSTAGDSKCTIDTLSQQESAVTRSRRFVARGFCTEPATTVTGDETLLIDRFDFAGAVPDDENRH